MDTALPVVPDDKQNPITLLDRMREIGFHRGVIALKDTNCACGRPKVAKQAFCPTCYRSLPADTRQGLYQRVGHGYEGAYDAAVVYLQETGRVTAPTETTNATPSTAAV